MFVQYSFESRLNTTMNGNEMTWRKYPALTTYVFVNCTNAALSFRKMVKYDGACEVMIGLLCQKHLQSFSATEVSQSLCFRVTVIMWL